MNNLDTFFRKCGLAGVQTTAFPAIPEQRRAFTDNMLWVFKFSCDTFAAREKATGSGVKSQWHELFEKTVIETKNGVSIAFDFIVVVGQKPE